MPTSFAETRVVRWLRRPAQSRAQAAAVAAAAGFFCVLSLFVVEALIAFGTVNPGRISLLRRYADIPAEVTEDLALRLASGTALVYLMVALYFAVGCGLVAFSADRRRAPAPLGWQPVISVALFAWVLTSATLKLLAVHPYAAESLPGGTRIEPLLRTWWSPGWAVAVTVVLGLSLAFFLGQRDPWAMRLRRGAMLFFFVPLLGPTISSLEVCSPRDDATKLSVAQPPVILIGIDSLRRDHVSRWGGPKLLTPHLDRFLSESYEFSNAWTVVGRTHPSYVSMLTARTPDRHGVRYNRADPYFARRLPKTFGHVLMDAGYSTRYLTDDNMFSSMGIEHGYQKVGQPPTMLETYATQRFMSFFFMASLPARWTSTLVPALKHNRAVHQNYDSKDFSDAVIVAVDEELEKHRPFFITAHTCTSHYPGSQPGPEFRAHQPKGQPILDYFKASLAHLKDGEMHVTTDRDERLRGLYRAGVQRADAELGRILAHLHETGLLDEAWVVVWSDHGEAFTDRKGKPILPSHGLAVDEGGEDLRIVLGIRPPGGSHQKIESAVSSVDIVPTILAGLGLPALPGEREGRTLLPLVEGKRARDPVLYAESGTHWGRKLDKDAAGYDFDLLQLYRFDAATAELVTRRHFHDKLILNKQRMVQLGDFRLVYEPMVDGSRRRRLFNWREGGKPARDVREHHPRVFAELTQALESHLADQEPERLKEGVKKDNLKSVWLPWMPAGVLEAKQAAQHKTK